MSMSRRGFLKSILAAGVAPAVVGSGALMPIRKIAVPRGTVFRVYQPAPIDISTLVEGLAPTAEPAIAYLDWKTIPTAINLNEDWMIKAMERMRETMDRMAFDAIIGARPGSPDLSLHYGETTENARYQTLTGRQWT